MSGPVVYVSKDDPVCADRSAVTFVRDCYKVHRSVTENIQQFQHSLFYERPDGRRKRLALQKFDVSTDDECCARNDTTVLTITVYRQR
jgi:hypothetical protein